MLPYSLDLEDIAECHHGSFTLQVKEVDGVPTVEASCDKCGLVKEELIGNGKVDLGEFGTLCVSDGKAALLPKVLEITVGFEPPASLCGGKCDFPACKSETCASGFKAY